MKPIEAKVFKVLLDNKLYWSKAYQSLTLSARNLLWCMVAELRFTGEIEEQDKNMRFLISRQRSRDSIQGN